MAGALAVSTLVPVAVHAHAGPPMVTDDPDTPGDGHWEINMAAAGGRNRTGALGTSPRQTWTSTTAGASTSS